MLVRLRTAVIILLYALARALSTMRGFTAASDVTAGLMRSSIALVYELDNRELRSCSNVLILPLDHPYEKNNSVLLF